MVHLSYTWMQLLLYENNPEPEDVAVDVVQVVVVVLIDLEAMGGANVMEKMGTSDGPVSPKYWTSPETKTEN